MAEDQDARGVVLHLTVELPPGGSLVVKSAEHDSVKSGTAPVVLNGSLRSERLEIVDTAYA